MTRALIGVLLLVGSCGTWAQNQGGTQAPADALVASAATPVAPAGLDATNTISTAIGDFALANPAGDPSAEPAATPAAKPRFVFGERDDYRWQLGVGVEFYRFQSNIYSASMVGLNTTLTYYTNSWFALEGNLITGFAPEIYQAEHVKMFGGAAGLRIGGRKQRFEPWAHGLVGGSHMQPQTAGNSKTALMAQAGVGVDYRLHSRLSLRLEGDWVFTQFFGQNQNNFQGVAGAVLHF